MDNKNNGQTIRCPYCMATNPITASICETCGKSLTEAPQNNLAMADSKVNNNVKFEGDISNTITGLLLLGIGTGIAWIPYIQYLGFLLNFIGVILIFLNRHNFESKHSTFVILSIIIYVFSIIIGVIAGVAGTLSIVSSTITSSTVSQSTITSEIQSIIISTIIAGMIGSLAYFTITYGLQDEKGKLILFIGMISYFIVEVIVGSILYSSLTSTVKSIFSSGSLNQSKLEAFSTTISIYAMLAVIPLVIYAFAYLRIRSIIGKEAGYGKNDDSAPA